jgi:hypothetical protein
MLCSRHFVSVVICFPKCRLIIHFVISLYILQRYGSKLRITLMATKTRAEGPADTTSLLCSHFMQEAHAVQLDSPSTTVAGNSVCITTVQSPVWVCQGWARPTLVKTSDAISQLVSCSVWVYTTGIHLLLALYASAAAVGHFTPYV